MKIFILLHLAIFQNLAQMVANDIRFQPSLPFNVTVSLVNPFKNLTLADKQRVVLAEEFPDWISTLSEIPRFISGLGQLLLLSSRRDFSLNTTSASGTTPIKFPQSFRATLVQLTQETWDTLLNAQTNMDNIKETLKHIPGAINLIKTLIDEASPEYKKEQVPVIFSWITTAGYNCSVWANDTSVRFSDLVHTLTTIIDMTQGVEGHQKEEVQKVKKEIEHTEWAARSIENLTDSILADLNAAEEEVKELKEKYEEQMEKIRDSGLGPEHIPLFREAVEKIFNTTLRRPGPDLSFTLEPDSGSEIRSNGFSTVMLIGGSMTDILENLGTIGKNVKRCMNAPQVEMENNMENISSETNSTSFNQADYDLFSLIAAIGSNEAPAFKCPVNTEGLQAASKSLQDLLAQVSTTNFSASMQWILNKTKHAVGSVDEVIHSLKDMKTGNNSREAAHAISAHITSLLENITLLIKDIDDGKWKSIDHDDDTPAMPHGNDYDLADARLVQLVEKMRQRDQLFRETIDSRKHRMNILMNISRLMLAKDDYDEVLNMTIEALKELNQLSLAWSNISRLFLHFSERAGKMTNTFRDSIRVLEMFCKSGSNKSMLTSAASASGNKTSGRKCYLLETFVRNALNINLEAYYLFFVAKSYTNMSKAFVIDRLSNLTTLVLEQDENTREDLALKLTYQCSLAQETILKFAVEHQQAYQTTACSSIEGLSYEQKKVWNTGEMCSKDWYSPKNRG